MELRIGGDDYPVKPFDSAVLVARIDALKRQYRKSAASGTGASANAALDSAPAAVIPFGAFHLDRSSHILSGPDGTIELSAQEYRFLEYLATHAGQVFEQNELLDSVWGYDRDVSTRTIDVHVVRLREKLGKKDHPRHIVPCTIQGMKGKLAGRVPSS